MKEKIFNMPKIATSQEQILEKSAILFTEKSTGEISWNCGLLTIEEEMRKIIEANSNYKFFKTKEVIDDCSIGVELDKNATNDEPRDLRSFEIIETYNFLRTEFNKIKMSELQKTELETQLYNAFQVGQMCGQLELLNYEKDIVNNIRNNAAKNKNNPEYWAKRLEEEYQQQPSKRSSKFKKSNCYYLINEEFEKSTERPSLTHKTLRNWWKKHYPQRFEKAKQ